MCTTKVFGGKDGKTLFVTGRGVLYEVGGMSYRILFVGCL